MREQWPELESERKEKRVLEKRKKKKVEKKKKETPTSATTDFPLPSTQLTAAGFLSVQKFPEREIISMSGKTS